MSMQSHAWAIGWSVWAKNRAVFVMTAAYLLVSSIAEALGFDRVCLWVFDKDGRTLYLKACHVQAVAAYRDTCRVDSSKITSFSLDRGEAVLVASSFCSFSGAKEFLGSSGETVVARESIGWNTARRREASET